MFIVCLKIGLSLSPQSQEIPLFSIQWEEILTVSDLFSNVLAGKRRLINPIKWNGCGGVQKRSRLTIKYIWSNNNDDDVSHFSFRIIENWYICTYIFCTNRIARIWRMFLTHEDYQNGVTEKKKSTHQNNQSGQQNWYTQDMNWFSYTTKSKATSMEVKCIQCRAKRDRFESKRETMICFVFSSSSTTKKRWKSKTFFWIVCASVENIILVSAQG